MKKEAVIIAGGGGHAKVVIDAVKRSGAFQVYGVVDPKLTAGEALLDVPVLGGDDLLHGLFSQGIKYAFLGIGTVGDCSLRKRVFGKLSEIGFSFPVILHPSAVIAEDVQIGDGTFVAAGTVINTGTKIGRNTIINTRASVDHDCAIGDFVHIAPGVILSGGVRIGDESHIGTGACITQYVEIGKVCVVGAGTTVRHAMQDRTRNYGTAAIGAHAKE